MLTKLALLLTPALICVPTVVAADDFYCYLETDAGQTISLGEICGGGGASGFGNDPFAPQPKMPTTDAEAAFLAEYTVAFFARDPDLAEYAPTATDLQGAVSDRAGFEEILDNAYRTCQGVPPLWLYPEFTELIFPGNTWAEFVEGLNTFEPLCSAR